VNPLLIPELRELILEKNENELRNFLERLHPAQAAELIEGLTPEELSWVLEILADEKEALIFQYLPENVQFELAVGAGHKELAKLVTALFPDDRAEFVRKLPPKIAQEILPLMAQAERNDVKRLLSFSEGTVGYRMTTEYAFVGVAQTCGEALEKVRHEAPNKESVYTLYVIDTDRHLEGVLGLKDLLLGRPDAPVKNLMRSEVMAVRADEPATKAAEIVGKYDLLAVPVVDDLGRLLGIVTVDDLIDVMERKATQDILSLGAVEPSALDKPYFENSIGSVVRKRIGWLLLLFVAEMFTGTVLRHFDDALERVVALSFFVPLLIGTGGNAGSQTVSTIIRSLALREINPKDWLRVLLKEGSSGLVLGLLLGVGGFCRSLMWEPNNYALAGTVGLTLVCICTWANSVGAIIPIFAQRAGLDPTVLSAPLITTVVDATGLLIYFTIALGIIPELSEPPAVISEELRQRVLDVAKDAPQELAEKLTEAVKVAQERSNEWALPLVALLVVGSILYFVSRPRKQS